MNDATSRAADVLLRALGGRTVTLRIPAPAVPADLTEQLGLATPQFQDIPLAPCVYRKARATLAEGKPAKSELLISASAIERIVGSLSYGSASILFANAVGVLAEPLTDSGTESDSASNAQLLEIISASAEESRGQPYVYRLILRAPQTQIT